MATTRYASSAYNNILLPPGTQEIDPQTLVQLLVGIGDLVRIVDKHTELVQQGWTIPAGGSKQVPRMVPTPAGQSVIREGTVKRDGTIRWSS